MSQRTIIFSSPEDVLNFVRTVEKYPYDMDLESGRAVVDAKSLLGLMNLGLNKEIELKVYDENCHDLFDEISEYFAAKAVIRIFMNEDLMIEDQKKINLVGKNFSSYNRCGEEFFEL